MKFSTVNQAWDFRPGDNFAGKMNEALGQCDRVLLVLSPNYLTSRFGEEEWQAAFAAKRHAILPVRVGQCDPPPLLRATVYIDLVDLPELTARTRLHDGLKRGRIKPLERPVYPRSTPTPQPRRFPAALPPICNLPHLRDPNFTGRDHELEALRTGPITPIAGLPGVGKTSLALEFAYRFAGDYQVIWWVPAETAPTLSSLAIKLEPSLRSAADENALTQFALDWLNQNPGWLLIFDNAPDPHACTPCLPRNREGKVLITSRAPHWRGLAPPLHLDKLPRAEAIAFLLKRAGKSDPNQADRLCQALGDLPLAIKTAAAFIEEDAISIDNYQAKYLRQGLEPVTAVFQAAFAKLDAAGTEILNLISFLAPDRIPRKLLGNDGDAGVRSLRKYSLIQAGEEDVSIHRLVQQIGRDRLEVAEKQQFVGLAVERVNDLFPSELVAKPEVWPLCAELLPHALSVTAFAENLGVGLESAGRLLNQAGAYEYTRARYSETLELYRRALEIFETVYGPDHPNLATLSNNIGQILKAQGDLAGALSYTQRALAIDEKVHGPDHPDVAIFSNNIGQILQAQSDLAGALSYTQRALAIDETVYGPDHPNVAIRANNIGTILQDQGDLAGALRYAKRALAIHKKVYGPDHPAVARDANNIGQILQAKGDFAGALSYTQRALAIDETVYGPDHPNVAIRANNIGQILKAQGDLAGARQMLQRALAIFTNFLGPDHPNVATLSNNIGQILQAQGDLAGALRYTQRALAIDEKVYGPDHPNVAIRANNIGLILKAQGDLAGARQMLQRALAIFTKILGPDHPRTKTVQRNLDLLPSTRAIGSK